MAAQPAQAGPPPPGSSAAGASPTGARAPTPPPLDVHRAQSSEAAENGGGSARMGRRTSSRLQMHADGSAHSGCFGGGAGSERQEQWQQAQAEERHMEERSQNGRYLVPPPAGAEGSGRHHQAVWIVEDGSGGRQQRAATPDGAHGSGAGWPPATPSEGSGKGGGRPAGWGSAVLSIEEPAERDVFEWGAYWGSLPKKLKGGLDTRLPVPPLRDLFWSWLGAFLGILAVCSLNEWASPEIDIGFLVGSFGASAVLVFGFLESKMSQPRNFLGGQMLSALVGITTRVVISETWIGGPVGMSLSLLLMQLTATTHPPGGATALIAATLPTLPKWHGYSYLVTVGVGSLTMQLIALVINNLDPRRRYPTFWW